MPVKQAKTGGNAVSAEPTRQFFIEMLTKDIELKWAVADLVDNSVDGARRLRAASGGDYSGLWVHIAFDQEHFEIADNCGGIPLDLARDYAFRFGRAPGMESTDYSVGLFGVGMKRALFKLGRWFQVESTAERSHFILPVNVTTWAENPGPAWSFEFDEWTEYDKKRPLAKRGTKIIARELLDGVKQEFALTFERELREMLGRVHEVVLAKGLAITVNGREVEGTIPKLKASKEIKPARQDYAFKDGFGPVDIRMFAGIGESEPEDAGWDVYCNERLIVAADKSDLTGWGSSKDTIPRFHNQYARFRGFVFFEAEDARALPWNTTKTSLDRNAEAYRWLRPQLLKMMQPVVRFLDEIKNEGTEGPRPLHDLAEAAPLQPITKITKASTFDAPTSKANRIKGPKMTRITYQRPADQVKRVKDALGVSTAPEVGEATFDYYYDAELLE